MEEDKRALENEKARIPNQHDADDKIKSLQKECDELRRQIAQKNAEISDHDYLLNDRRKKAVASNKQLDDLTHSKEALEVGVRSAPLIVHPLGSHI